MKTTVPGILQQDSWTVAVKDGQPVPPDWIAHDYWDLVRARKEDSQRWLLVGD